MRRLPPPPYAMDVTCEKCDERFGRHRYVDNACPVISANGPFIGYAKDPSARFSPTGDLKREVVSDAE